jgi:pyruvate/2-oxoglutarate dehydrogenase complex dihydrolipoamide acyltransferase (E2) component
VASTPAAKREAALHGVALHDVVQAGAIPPLHRVDVLAFVQSKQTREVRATPLAQKIAQEHQIDLTALSTLKAGAKVTRADVEAHLASEGALSNNAHRRPVHEPSTPVVEGPTKMLTEQQVDSQSSQESELIPLSPVRRLIGQRMLSSITTAPHIYLDTEIDMTEAERCRQRIGLRLKEQGEAVPSLTALLLRACAAALRSHPEVNATLEVGGYQGKDAIRRWHVVHIGVAVDTGQALLTPVIRNAHRQTLPELARELRRLTQAAREGILSPEEMANATFTISNLGMYGIDTFHAIIPPGQSAILAVGKTTKRGVVIEDAQGERLEIRPIMKVSLSADHRVLDGAGGSRFLQRLKAFLEDPYLLL